MKAPLPDNESARLQALQNLDIVDTPNEKSFDDIVAIAAMICQVPTAVISLVDKKRQWFKAGVGVEVTETPRDMAFCAHAILSPHQLTLVEDARQDQRFQDNPLVTDNPGIRFYAGAPLVTQSGAALGTLCVIDYQPRGLSADQEQALAALARQVMQLFNLRAANQRLQHNAESMQLMSDSLPVLLSQLDRQGRYVFCNKKYQEWYRIAPADMLGKTPEMVFGKHLSPQVAENMARCFAGESAGFELQQASGRALQVNYVPQLEANNVTGLFIVATDITERKQHEQALSKERERLAAIIAGANVGTWELNVQSGVTQINRRWAEMLGFTLEELSPVNFSTWQSLTHPEDLAHANTLLQEHFDGKREYYDCRFRMLHKRCYWVWVHAHGQVSRRAADNKPLEMFGTHVDISALVESRQALEENEERFRSMLSNLPGAVYRCANDARWTMQFLSEGVHQLTGHAAADFLAEPPMSFAEIIHPEDARVVTQAVDAAVEAQRGFEVRYRIHHADGSWRWVQEVGRGIFTSEGELKYLDGFIWDITERELINSAMQVNEQKLSTLYNTVPVAIALHEFPSGQLIEANPEFFRMTGYSEAEIRALDYWELTPRRYQREEQAQMELLLQTGYYGPFEKNYLHKDGHLIPVLVNGVMMQAESGIKTVWSIIQDITERQRNEQMKNEFVSAVSHELRTPLTSISGALKLMSSGALGEIPEKSRTMLDIAYKNSQRLTLLINDLLDMEKLLAGKMNFSLKLQPLLPLLERAVYENQTYADQYQVTLQLNNPVADVNVLLDEQRFLQVMANLLSNAAKFSPAGEMIKISMEARDNQVRVIVADRGAGIPLEFQPRIFRKFSQADSSDSRKKGGTGLGLAISKELLENMSASISFESIPGVGTSFHIDIKVH